MQSKANSSSFGSRAPPKRSGDAFGQDGGRSKRGGFIESPFAVSPYFDTLADSICRSRRAEDGVGAADAKASRKCAASRMSVAQERQRRLEELMLDEPRSGLGAKLLSAKDRLVQIGQSYRAGATETNDGDASGTSPGAQGAGADTRGADAAPQPMSIGGGGAGLSIGGESRKLKKVATAQGRHRVDSTTVVRPATAFVRPEFDPSAAAGERKREHANATTQPPHHRRRSDDNDDDDLGRVAAIHRHGLPTSAFHHPVGGAMSALVGADGRLPAMKKKKKKKKNKPVSLYPKEEASGGNFLQEEAAVDDDDDDEDNAGDLQAGAQACGKTVEVESTEGEASVGVSKKKKRSDKRLLSPPGDQRDTAASSVASGLPKAKVKRLEAGEVGVGISDDAIVSAPSSPSLHPHSAPQLPHHSKTSGRDEVRLRHHTLRSSFPVADP